MEKMRRVCVMVAGVGLLGAGWATAQEAQAAQQPTQEGTQPQGTQQQGTQQQSVPAPAGRVAETPVQGLVRSDLYTVALTVPGKRIEHDIDAGPDVQLHDFSFEGEAVTTNKLHFKELAPGVVEITSIAYSLGDWQFQVRDAANYYGLGERFNTLNHAQTVVKNASQDNGDCEGVGDVQAGAVLHEHDGLWAVGGYDG